MTHVLRPVGLTRTTLIDPSPRRRQMSPPAETSRRCLIFGSDPRPLDLDLARAITI
jgi:hypothetical protein